MKFSPNFLFTRSRSCNWQKQIFLKKKFSPKFWWDEKKKTKSHFRSSSLPIFRREFFCFYVSKHALGLVTVFFLFFLTTTTPTHTHPKRSFCFLPLFFFVGNSFLLFSLSLAFHLIQSKNSAF